MSFGRPRALRQTDEILRKASACFARAELDRPLKRVIAFIDDHRAAHGVEPICKLLPIAPSTWPHRPDSGHMARRADPDKLSARARRDLALKPEIERIFAAHFKVYGARKVWRQMVREGRQRCTFGRLMADLGLRGAIRGKPVRTTVRDTAASCPPAHAR